MKRISVAPLVAAIIAVFLGSVVFITRDIRAAGGDSQRTPGSLTTLFASDNGFAGNMFDITPANDLEIIAIDINAEDMGNTAQVDVYYRAGTCVGFENSSTGWKLLASGKGTIAGKDKPTYVDLLGNGKIFQAGQTYGIYVDLKNFNYSPQIRLLYTTGKPTTYSNPDLSLTSHCGKGVPAFAGITYFDRIWNGTIYYDTKGESLAVDPDSISAANGGKVDFQLNAGVSNQYRQYMLIGGVTGMWPGILLPDGTVLPLNWDAFTWISISLANTPVFPNTLSQLNSIGQSTAAFDTLGPLPSTMVGLTLFFAYALPGKKGMPWFASNGVIVYVVP